MDIMDSDNVSLVPEEWGSSEVTAIQAVMVTASAVSLLGSSLMVAFLSMKGGYNFKLLLCLSLSDIASNIATIVSIGIDEGPASHTCDVVGAIVQYTDLCPILWTACISCSLYVSVFFRNARVRSVLFKCFLVFAFGVPAIPAVIGYLRKDYGDAGYGLCWVRDERERIYYFYITLWVVVAANVFAYFRVEQAYRRCVAEFHGLLTPVGRDPTRVGHLKYYPLVLVVCWLMGFAHRIASLTGVDNDALFPVMLIHSLFSRLQGVLNAVVYGFDPLQELHPWLKSFCRSSTDDPDPLPINACRSHSSDSDDVWMSSPHHSAEAAE